MASWWIDSFKCICFLYRYGVGQTAEVVDNVNRQTTLISFSVIYLGGFSGPRTQIIQTKSKLKVFKARSGKTNIYRDVWWADTTSIDSGRMIFIYIGEVQLVKIYSHENIRIQKTKSNEKAICKNQICYIYNTWKNDYETMYIEIVIVS